MAHRVLTDCQRTGVPAAFLARQAELLSDRLSGGTDAFIRFEKPSEDVERRKFYLQT